MADILFEQAILNVVWARQFLPEADLQAIADALAAGNSLPNKPIGDVIERVNRSLASLSFEIRRGTSESDGKCFYAMCNLKADASSQLATHFKPVELRYFRQVIDAIMKSKPSGSAVLADALNARLEDDQTKTLAAADAKHLLQAFIAENWLSSPSDGYVAIGPRCLLELRQFIEGEYEEFVVECTLCADIVFKGETCVNVQCPAKLHHHCARTWFRGKPRKCPACTNPWQEVPPGWEDTEPIIAPPPRTFHPNAVAID